MVTLLKSVIKNPKGWSYDGIDSNEHLVYVFRKSLITTIPWLFITFVLTVLPSFIAPFVLTQTNLSYKFIFIVSCFWYIGTFGYFFQSFLNWFFNVYIVSDKKIIDVDFHGLIYGNISEAKLSDVEDVTSKIHGAIRTVFEFGDVFVQTAGESPQFEFHDVPDPANVRDLIADLVENIKKETDD